MIESHCRSGASFVRLARARTISLGFDRRGGGDAHTGSEPPPPAYRRRRRSDPLGSPQAHVTISNDYSHPERLAERLPDDLLTKTVLEEPSLPEPPALTPFAANALLAAVVTIPLLLMPFFGFAMAGQLSSLVLASYSLLLVCGLICALSLPDGACPPERHPAPPLQLAVYAMVWFVPPFVMRDLEWSAYATLPLGALGLRWYWSPSRGVVVPLLYLIGMLLAPGTIISTAYVTDLWDSQVSKGLSITQWQTQPVSVHGTAPIASLHTVDGSRPSLVARSHIGPAGMHGSQPSGASTLRWRSAVLPPHTAPPPPPPSATARDAASQAADAYFFRDGYVVNAWRERVGQWSHETGEVTKRAAYGVVPVLANSSCIDGAPPLTLLALGRPGPSLSTSNAGPCVHTHPLVGMLMFM